MKKMKPKRIISFLSQKGGVGKSSLASLLAFGLAKNGLEEITIIDGDTSQSSMISFFRRRTAAMEGVNSLEKIKVTLGTSEKYESYISNNGDTIFDMPGMASKKTLTVAKLSTHIFIPINPTIMTAEPQVTLANEFIEHGISSSKIAFVFNLSQPSSNVEDVKRYMNRYLTDDVAVLEEYLPSQVAYERANNYGKCFTEVSFKSLRDKACRVQEAMLKFVS